MIVKFKAARLIKENIPLFFIKSFKELYNLFIMSLILLYSGIINNNFLLKFSYQIKHLL